MANILVCDDDREIADAIEIYLRSEGQKVIKASCCDGYHDACFKWH